MATIILLVILVLLAFWVIGAYNGLITLKNQVANAWKQIDVQLKRRHDLIPILVNTVKGAMDFERGTLEAVIAARNKAVSATGVHQTAQAEGELTQALGRQLPHLHVEGVAACHQCRPWHSGGHAQHPVRRSGAVPAQQPSTA